MIDFYALGEQHFWEARGELPSVRCFSHVGDYCEFLAGFEDAWEAHDWEVTLTEKPWMQYGFGAESREYIPL